MNPTYICSICGQSTYSVDLDYLIGVDHLACHLSKSLKMNKIVIENWKKLNGQTFHTLGCELVINDCDIKEKCYEAWIYQTRITPSEALMRVDLWFDYEIGIKVFHQHKLQIHQSVCIEILPKSMLRIHLYS